MLQPVVRRSWAPRGRTPILRQWDRRDRLSAISALSVSGRRQRFNLYWALYPHNIRSEEVLDFLQDLRRHLPRGFILIWDRGKPHRAQRVQDWLAKRKQITIEWLPPYAPDLNPVECVWSRTKYGDLANFTPDTLSTLEDGVTCSLCRTRSQQDLFHGFFQGAGLKL
jgi:transposase